MQEELDRHNPSLQTYVAAINELGRESGNSLVDQPLSLLQDVDANFDTQSDIWTLWNAEWRDVNVLDRENNVTFVVNLTTSNLAVPDNYNALKQAFISAGVRTPTSQYQSGIEPLDVNSDGFVAPLDPLLVINELGKYPNGRPPVLPNGTPPSSYFDPTGDNIVAPLDALLIINHLSKYNNSNRAASASHASTIDLPTEEGLNAIPGAAAIVAPGSEASPASAPGGLERWNAPQDGEPSTFDPAPSSTEATESLPSISRPATPHDQPESSDVAEPEESPWATLVDSVFLELPI